MNWDSCLVHKLPATLLILISFILTGSASGAVDISFGYDPTGRLTSAVYSNGKRIFYTYDSNGNLLDHTTTQGGDPSPDPSCFSNNSLMIERQFTGGITKCESSTAIQSLNSRVFDKTRVIFKAPTITLNSGFEIRPGGSFQAVTP